MKVIEWQTPDPNLIKKDLLMLRDLKIENKVHQKLES
jgi:hypothetical protein